MKKTVQRLVSLLCTFALVFGLFVMLPSVPAARALITENVGQPDGQAEMIARAKTDFGQKIYSGKTLEQTIIPMGGLGSGAVYFDGNARVVNWDIGRLTDMNLANENSLFTVTVDDGAGGKITKRLQGDWDVKSRLPEQPVKGRINPPPTSTNPDSFTPVNYNKEGEYFIGTSEIAMGYFKTLPNSVYEDLLAGSIRSDLFVVPDDCTQYTALVGGGNGANDRYLALLDAETHQIIGTKLTGNNSEAMTRRTVAVPEASRGRKAYFEIVDLATGGWGHINVDDIRLQNGDTLLNVYADYQDGDFKNGNFEDGLNGWSQRGRVTDIEAFNDTSLKIEYPFANYMFSDDDMPIDAEMEIVNPMVPLNVEDSCLPVVFFNITLTNKTDAPIEASILSTMGNGISGTKENTAVQNENGTFVSLTSNRTSIDQQTGSMSIWTGEPGAKYSAGAMTVEALVAQVEGNGLNGVVAGNGSDLIAGLSVPVTIPANGSKTLTFNWSWYFPHFRGSDLWGSDSTDVSRRYVDEYDNLDDVMADIGSRRSQLLADTSLYRDTMYDTNLPYYLIDTVTYNSSILRSRTTYVTKDGDIYAWEGSDAFVSSGGNWHGNCMHVWNYAQTTGNLFPELARRWKEQNFARARVESGTNAGLLYNRLLNVPAKQGDVGEAPAVDGVLGTIEGAYREHLNSADNSFLTELWPYIKGAMDASIRVWDPDHDGLMDKAGTYNTTFDGRMDGINTFTGAQYLAALRAAEKMALVMGDDASANLYREIYTKGSVNLSQATFNGEYFIQSGANQYGNGLMVDHLLGQSHAFLDQLGYVLPEEEVKTALASTFKYNFFYPINPLYSPHKGEYPRMMALPDDAGLLNCTFPYGGTPNARYLEEIWPGFEHAVATAMMYAGLVDEALACIYAVRDRHDGEGFNQLNEKEAGDFYSRSLSSYGLLNAAIGLERNGPAKSLGFKPNYQPEDIKGFFTYVDGWGTFEQQRETTDGVVRQENAVSVAYGNMTIKNLNLSLSEETVLLKHPSAAVTLNGTPVPVDRLERNGGRLNIVFDSDVNLVAGDKLEVTASAAADKGNIDPWDDVVGTWIDDAADKIGAADAGAFAFSLAPQTAASFALEGDITVAEGTAGFVFGSENDPSAKSLAVALDLSDGKIKLLKAPNAVIAEKTPEFALNSGETYHVKLEIYENRVKMYLNGVLYEFAMDDYSPGKFGLYVSGGSAAFGSVFYTPLASDIALNRDRLSLYPGEREKLTAMVAPDNAADKNVIWKSSDESIAKVSDLGLVTAVSGGTAIITASVGDGGCVSACEVRVRDELPLQPLSDFSQKINTITWEEIEGGYSFNSSGDAALLSPTTGADFVYEADFKLNNYIGAIGLFFRSTDKPFSDGGYVVNVGNGYVKIFKFPYKELAPVYNPDIQTNTVYHVKVIVRGSKFTVYFNNQEEPLFEITDTTLRNGKFGIAVYRGNKHDITNIKYTLIPPSDVTDLQMSLDSGNLSLSWKDPADGVLDSVRILNEDGSVRQQVNKGVEQAVISGLEEGTSYSFRVCTEAQGLLSEGVVVNIQPANLYDISVAPMENGTVIADKEQAAAGEEVTLTVTPDDGYRLMEGSLQYNGIPIVGESFEMPAENVSISAAFELIPSEPIVSAEVVPGVIVNGYAANVRINVAINDLSEEDVVTVSLFGKELAVDNGTALFKFAANEIPVADVYNPVIKRNGEEVHSGAQLEVVPKNDDIWTVNVIPGEESTELGFNAYIEPKKGTDFVVIINDGTPMTFTRNGNILTIPYVVQPGEKLVIKNVKYPILFPSYSFTFTLTYHPFS